MAKVMGYHFHDYIMGYKTPTQQTGLKDTPLLALKK